MKRLFASVVLLALGAAAYAQASKEEVLKALNECAEYSGTVLLGPDGRSRCDYNMTEGKWYPYEEPWHTGQIIYGLVEAARVTGNAKYLEYAVKAGNWWMTLEIKGDGRFDGMVGATHGDVIGNDHIVFATVSDGTPGLFALSAATGDPKYADLATSAAEWMYDHMYYPEKMVCYDLVELSTGDLVTEHSRFHDDKEKQTLFDVSRPNTEGSLFMQAYQHNGDNRLRAAHILLCDGLVKYADKRGLWMQFTPNNKAVGSYHPRFNLWYAESLLECYDLTGDEKYLKVAARTARTYAKAQQKTGTMFYDNYIDGSFDKGSVCGSEVALAGILWIRLAEDYGYPEFKVNYERSASWLVANRYALDHPDPNLRGAVVNTRMRNKKGKVWLTHRDVGTSFGMRFFSMYYEKVLNK